MIKLNSVAFVRKQAIPTERPLLVGERVIIEYEIVGGMRIAQTSDPYEWTSHVTVLFSFI
jgi:hypothetical protein